MPAKHLPHPESGINLRISLNKPVRRPRPRMTKARTRYHKVFQIKRRPLPRKTPTFLTPEERVKLSLLATSVPQSMQRFRPL